MASLAFARAAGQLVDISGGIGGGIGGGGGSFSVGTSPGAHRSTTVSASSTSSSAAGNGSTCDGCSIPSGVRWMPRVVSVINGRDLVARLSLSNAGR